MNFIQAYKELNNENLTDNDIGKLFKMEFYKDDDSNEILIIRLLSLDGFISYLYWGNLDKSDIQLEEMHGDNKPILKDNFSLGGISCIKKADSDILTDILSDEYLEVRKGGFV